MNRSPLKYSYYYNRSKKLTFNDINLLITLTFYLSYDNVFRRNY